VAPVAATPKSVPMPVNAMVCVAFVESLIRIVPEAGPVVVAVKTTGIVQLDPEKTGMHVPPLCENGPENVIELRVVIPAVLFVTVSS